MYKAIDYDPVRSFELIGLVAEGSIILVVNPLQRWRSVAELVADAKANAGKLKYGSAGTGTVPHLSGELFRSPRASTWSTCRIAGAPCRSPTS